MRYIIMLLAVLMAFHSCKSEEDEKQEDLLPKKRPNIVYIMADNHAEQAISAYGHPISKLAPTPNIDRIAAESALFRNNFCTNSICEPSRAVMLNGKFSHLNGFRKNDDRFDGNQQTFSTIQ
jgi:arylsulfatase A-like enzyme